MSRGLGAWQRLILAALQHTEAIPVGMVATVRYGNPTRSDLVAVRRAAKSLAEATKVRAIYMWVPTWDESRFTPQLVVTRPDSDIQGNAFPPGGDRDWIVPSAAKRPDGSLGVRLSTRAIASMLGVSHSTAARYIKTAR